MPMLTRGVEDELDMSRGEPASLVLGRWQGNRAGPINSTANLVPQVFLPSSTSAGSAPIDRPTLFAFHDRILPSGPGWPVAVLPGDKVEVREESQWFVRPCPTCRLAIKFGGESPVRSFSQRTCRRGRRIEDRPAHVLADDPEAVAVRRVGDD